MSEISNTKWQMVYQDDNIVAIDSSKERIIQHGDPRAYNHAKFPEINSSKWVPAPVASDPVVGEKVVFSYTSKLPTRYKPGESAPSMPVTKLHFTYFRTFVNIPDKAKVKSFKVIINEVDDGARVYLFNRNHPHGKHVSQDAKLNGTVESIDFSTYAAEGENLIGIVQFDDCGHRNELKGGIDIIINNTKIKTNTKLPIPSSIYKFAMSSEPKVNPSNPKEATGEIHGINYTFISDKNVTVSHDHGTYGFNQFPADQNIPKDQKSIENTEASKNTIRFGSEMKDPVLIFASIGNKDKEVGITFYNDIEIVYKKGLTSIASRRIAGKEGYAVVKLEGTYREIKFDYEQAEKSVHFLFGASI